MAQRVGSIPVKKAGHRTSTDTSVRAGPGLSGFLECVKRSLTLRAVGLAAVGFLLGRASILGLLSPFGVAYYSALKAGGERHLALVFGGVLAASAYRPGSSLTETALVLGAVHMAFSLLGLERDKPGMFAALVSSGITLAVGVVFQLTGTAGEYGYLVSVFEAFLTGLLTLVFLHAVISLREGDRASSGEETLSAVLLMTAAVAGLAGLEVGSLRLELQHIAGGLVVIILAYAGGSGLGATSGAILGVVTSLSDSLSPAGVGVYAFAGLLAGVFRELGKPGVGAGYFLGSAMLSLYLDQVGQLNRAMMEAGIAVGAFLLVPSGVLQFIRRTLSGQMLLEERPSADQVARDFLTRRIRELAQVFRELSRAFDQVASSEQPKVDRDLTKIFEAVSSRVCQNCAMYRTCWTNELYKTSHLVGEVWGIAEATGNLTVRQIPEEFRKRCIHPVEVAACVNYIYDLHRVNYYWEKRIRESREIVSGQLKGVSQIMEGLSEEVVERIRTASAAAPQNTASTILMTTGVAKLAKKGSLVSGDSYLVRQLDNQRLVLALSDGMGAGPRASMESRATISLLEQLLANGFESDMAVRTVNSILLLRSPEEMFATVDLAVIDLKGGEAEFTKIGAAPSFVKRRNEVTVIKTASLPAGILNQIDVEPTRKILRPGDTLVMVTDGLWDLKKGEPDKERWIVEFLQSTSGTDPQPLAESLLARALEGTDRNVSDDMMVVIAQVDSQSSAPQGTYAASAEVEWASAKPAQKKAARPRRTDLNG